MLTVVTPTRLAAVAADAQEREFRADEVVLGKLPGYPAWPSVVRVVSLHESDPFALLT
jgi:hypothetical protein